jgi:hypothetical protein
MGHTEIVSMDDQEFCVARIAEAFSDGFLLTVSSSE